MSGTRDLAIGRAKLTLSDGTYLAQLGRLVAFETESQDPSKRGALLAYWRDGLVPVFAAMGFVTIELSDDAAKGPPVFLATRIEDETLPTVLIYGHGDVVAAHAASWSEGLDPFILKVEGDRVYGRGTADNKGQHLVAISALKAVLDERGALGFNVKFLIETGEELGSPGLADLLAANREMLAADVFIGSDGPRQSLERPEMRLGARGGVTFDLDVNLRDGVFHSGHWGGVLADAGFVLSGAIASIVDRNGKILVPGWRPDGIPASVRAVCRDIEFETVEGLPEIDADWGEPGLSKAEKIYAWTSVAVLAMQIGEPAAPVNAVQGKAWARLQVRHDVGIDGDAIVPALRSHLDALGYQAVTISPLSSRTMFPASRTDPAEPWVQFVGASLRRSTTHAPNIVPNSSGGNPSGLFQQALEVPVIWIPHSYGGCGQHGPDEHLLMPLVNQGLIMMTGLFWDIGSGDAPLSKFQHHPIGA